MDPEYTTLNNSLDDFSLNDDPEFYNNTDSLIRANISARFNLDPDGDWSLFEIPHPEEMLNPSKRNPVFYHIIITHAVTFIIGILGNLIAVFVMVGDRKSRNATNLFLVSLAVADLLLLLLCVPLEVLQYFLQFDGNEFICKMAKYILLLSASASVLNLCAVSLERFIVIVFPMRSRSLCTLSNCRKAILLVWVVATVLSLPELLIKDGYFVIYTNNVTFVKVYYCESADDNLPFVVYQFVILFAAPGLLMMICYMYVIRELWRSTKNISILTNSARSPAPHQHQTNNMRRENSPRSQDHNVGTAASSAPSTKEEGEEDRALMMVAIESQTIDEEKDGNNETDFKEGTNPEQILGPGENHESDQTITQDQADGNNGMASNVQNNSKLSTAKVTGGQRGRRLLDNLRLTKRRNKKHEGRKCRRGTTTSTCAAVTIKSGRDDVKRARKQVIKMLLLVIVLFLICWGPKLIFSITLKIADKLGVQVFTAWMYNMKVIFNLIPFIHSSFNPVIYSFMSKNFRRSMTRQLHRLALLCGIRRGRRGTSSFYRGLRSRSDIPLRSTATMNHHFSRRANDPSHNAGNGNSTQPGSTTSLVRNKLAGRSPMGESSTYCSNFYSEASTTRHTEVHGISTI